MLTQQSIRDFLAQSDYDIRESGNGRWIDQKCTPDVVCAVADFICNYVADDPSPESYAFTSKEIWHSEYASQYVEAVFKKPATKNKNAKHEYDKFFQQPMEMFANAKILLKTKQGRRNIYQVNRLDILEYIRFLYNGIIIKHQKTEPTYTKTSLFLCEKRRFFMARREKGVVPIIYFEKERGKSF